MPLYDYQCQQCQRHTEKIQKFSDAPLTECPHCGGHLERVLHAPAVAFKGGGWYADGYGNKKSRGSSENKGDSAGASKSDSTGASKSSDSKTDSSSKSSTESSSSGSSSTSAPSTSPAPASTPAASSSSSDKK